MDLKLGPTGLHRRVGATRKDESGMADIRGDGEGRTPGRRGHGRPEENGKAGLAEGREEGQEEGLNEGGFLEIRDGDLADGEEYWDPYQTPPTPDVPDGRATERMPPREDPARRGTLAAVLRKEVPLTLQDNWWENEGFPDPRDTPKPRTSAMAQRRVPGPTLGQALADHHRTAQTRDGNRTHATAPVPKVAPETAQTHPPEPNPKPAPALTPVPPPPPSTAPPTAPPTAPRDRLGEQLVDAGLISRDQLRVAITEQKGTGAMMGTVLVELGFITDGALAEVMAHNSGRDRFDPAATVPDPAALSPLPEAEARRLRVFPVGLRGTLLRLAMADPMDVVAIDAVRRHYRKDIRVEPLASGEGEIQTAIDGAYGHELSLDGVLRELEALGERGGDTDVISDTAAHPVVRLVNALLLNAVKRRASDIHFEPDGAFLRVRERVDGVLRQSLTFHKQYWAAVCQRVKILAGMDIADRLNPQDGRFSMAVSHRKVDFRASIVPTVHGENLVLRILDRSATPLKLEHLGLDQRVMDTLRLMIRRPEGMLLVVGPTGSGKTTTLYALMDHISGPDLNIVTLEDPVEYDLPLLRQTQVRDGGRMGFADGIRAMLRQDPDVILVGEVRDPDTAAMALRAAMTGHQVYSTLHANDAISALSRLADLGLRQGLLSGALMGILAQRLARKLCVKCRQAYQASPVECRILGVDPQTGPTIHRSQGCEACGQTGYRGRVPLTELLTVTPDVDALLADGAPISEIRALAGRQGYRPMVSNGARLVLDGVIDVAALMRAVDITGRLA